MKSLTAAAAGLFLIAANSSMAADKPLSTDDFVKTVAISDMFEVEAGKVAQDKGTAEQKKFGAMMVKDHSKTSTELKSLVSGGKVKAELPAKLDSQHETKLEGLKKASGKEFAAAYKSTQVQAHQDAIRLFESYSRDGDDPDLKAWAGKTLPALKHHSDMAQKL